jgi:hypothetical protein
MIDTKEDVLYEVMNAVLDSGYMDTDFFCELILNIRQTGIVNSDFVYDITENAKAFDKITINTLIYSAYEYIVNELINKYELDIEREDYFEISVNACASSLYFDKDKFIADNEDMLQQADEIEAIINQF